MLLDFGKHLYLLQLSPHLNICFNFYIFIYNFKKNACRTPKLNISFHKELFKVQIIFFLLLQVLQQWIINFVWTIISML